MRSTIASVSFIMYKDGQVLIEKRSKDKRAFPGINAIPSGGIEVGEDPKNAAMREIVEEFGVEACDLTYLGRLMQPAKDVTFECIFYLCENWIGDIKKYEADELFWISIDDKAKVDLVQDRIILEQAKEIIKFNEENKKINSP